MSTPGIQARRMRAGVAAIIGLGISAAMAATPARPATTVAAAEQRLPSADERATFEDFFRVRKAANPRGAWNPPPLFTPAFEIARQRGKPWLVTASIDSAPHLAGPGLCRQIRSRFVYDSTGAPGARWTDAASAPEWHVWLLQAGTSCGVARYTTLMHPALPAPDATALLRQHRELLLRARLLFAGNTGCAPQRALTFRLAGLEPVAPGATPALAGAPPLFGMVFESDRDTVARVAVRKHRGEYVAWNVSCSG